MNDPGCGVVDPVLQVNVNFKENLRTERSQLREAKEKARLLRNAPIVSLKNGCVEKVE